MKVKIDRYYSDAHKSFALFCRAKQVRECLSTFDGINIKSVVALTKTQATELKALFQDVDAVKISELSAHGPLSIYEVVMERYFIDQYERRVVEDCISKGTKFTFMRTADGMHHYTFESKPFSDRSEYLPSFKLSDVPSFKLSGNKGNVLPKKPTVRPRPKTLLGKVKAWLKSLTEFRDRRLQRDQDRRDWQAFVDSLGGNLPHLRVLAGYEEETPKPPK